MLRGSAISGPVLPGWRAWLARPVSGWALALAALAGHVYGLSLGAGFWVDAEAYVMTARIFGPEGGRFFSTPEYAVFSHAGWGMPFVWFLLSKLPPAWVWPALALFQHGAGFAAQVYAFRVLNRIWPSRIHLLFCALMSFLPIYQSMHNMLMTESLSASCLLAGFAAAALILEGRGGRRTFWLAVALFGLAVQARYVYAPALALVVLVLFLAGRVRFSRAALAAACCAGFVFAYPAYAWIVSGTPHIPRVTVWKLMTGKRIAGPDTSRVRAFLETLDLPEPGFAERLMRVPDADALGRLDGYWREKGYGDRERAALYDRVYAEYAATAERTWPERAFGALAMSGLTVPIAWLPEDRPLSNAALPAPMAGHQRAHYRYLSWTAPDEAEYRSLSEKYFWFSGPQGPAEKAFFLEAWEPWLRFGPGGFSRDPLGLGRVWPDAFAVLGLVSLAYLARRRVAAFWAALAVFLPHVLVPILLPGLAGIRYVYPCLSLYILWGSMACAVWIRGSAARGRP